MKGVGSPETKLQTVATRGVGCPKLHLHTVRMKGVTPRAYSDNKTGKGCPKTPLAYSENERVGNRETQHDYSEKGLTSQCLVSSPM